MYRHEPAGYRCPFCTVAGGGETEWNRRGDVVFRDARTTAFVSPKWWARNPGHVIVVPNEHHENLYAIPVEALAAVSETVQRIAVAIRATSDCAGTSTRQHNELGGGQDVWHFHVHVFPRTEGDGLYDGAAARWVPREEREPFAVRLRAYLEAGLAGVPATVAETVAETRDDS